MNRSEFEEEFHTRTVSYLPEYRDDGRPVVISLGESAHSGPGHLLTIALVNQLARAHRTIVLVGKLDRPLQCADHFGFQTLEGATIELARAINPFIDVDNALRKRHLTPLLTLGIGAAGDLQLGCDGWRAQIGEGAEIEPRQSSALGAALASCLGSAAALHRLMGHDSHCSGSFSLWADVSPSDEEGPEHCGPIDVGRVLQVGAGAVGCALNYWMGFLGVAGEWLIVDGDKVEVSNLNRQLLFLAADAGFPDDISENKAAVVAKRMGAHVSASPLLYGNDSSVVEAQYDLVLPLANEHGVRPALQSRAQTLLLHATTTPNWTANLHRHVAGHDDCIVCRLPGQTPAVMACSTARVGSKKPTDASLPFLSGLAGLLLLGDLIRLKHGKLMEKDYNFVAVDLRTSMPTVGRLTWPCEDGCNARMPAVMRIPRTTGTRFAHLDGEA